MRSTYEWIGPDGTHIYYDNTKYAMLREGLDGLSGGTAEINTTTVPGVIGEILQSKSVKRRTFSLPQVILGNGRAELELRRDILLRAYNNTLGVGTLIWNKEDGTRRFLRAISEAGYPSFKGGTTHDAHMWEVDVDMIALDPCWYADTDEEIILRGFTGGFNLPFELPFDLGGVGTTVDINNPGTISSGLTLELRGKLVNPIIRNLTTGKHIMVKQTVNSGEVLRITTHDGNRSVTLIGTSGEVNALNYVTLDSRFLQIPPGTCRITYTADEEGSDAMGYLRYTPRWAMQ